MDEAAECDAILLMRDGAILRQTTPDGLRSETGEPDLEPRVPDGHQRTPA